MPDRRATSRTENPRIPVSTMSAKALSRMARSSPGSRGRPRRGRFVVPVSLSGMVACMSLLLDMPSAGWRPSHDESGLSWYPLRIGLER
jgi:hypothetical protein